jgi:hypothetical protein
LNSINSNKKKNAQSTSKCDHQFLQGCGFNNAESCSNKSVFVLPNNGRTRLRVSDDDWYPLLSTLISFRNALKLSWDNLARIRRKSSRPSVSKSIEGRFVRSGSDCASPFKLIGRVLVDRAVVSRRVRSISANMSDWNLPRCNHYNPNQTKPK